MSENNDKKPVIRSKVIRSLRRDEIAAKFNKRAREKGDKFLINKTDIQLLKLKGASDEELQLLDAGKISYNFLKIKYKIQ